ncbi:hypothetical protein WG66_013064 [Moniliophthora roreri]|uniref:Uncharacterized protein n=1 Tax=Moniliophthora roreri TaxID=221103 RepID=A0A0W0FDN7_MONRR|nr:hypothetical protein WG66_013064 [Moniliophthora roreri]
MTTSTSFMILVDPYDPPYGLLELMWKFFKRDMTYTSSYSIHWEANRLNEQYRQISSSIVMDFFTNIVHEKGAVSALEESLYHEDEL